MIGVFALQSGEYTDPETAQRLRSAITSALKPKPKSKQTTLPQEQPKPSKQRRKEEEPYDEPLPISWPHELPVPELIRRLRRSSKGDLIWEGIDRGPKQREFQTKIKKANESIPKQPPPRPCFEFDAEPFDRFHAHHICILCF